MYLCTCVYVGVGVGVSIGVHVNTCACVCFGIGTGVHVAVCVGKGKSKLPGRSVPQKHDNIFGDAALYNKNLHAYYCYSVTGYIARLVLQCIRAGTSECWRRCKKNPHLPLASGEQPRKKCMQC